ncbi:MAG: hypothetical protein FWE12_00555 [Oscillospiraceae bacterium]|nr:hypothetical protein [Oscillospiraceae bacterium]
MKKVVMMFGLLLFVIGLTGCGGTEAAPAEPEVSKDVIPVTERVTVQLETGEISLALPDGWDVVRTSGPELPFAERTYTIRLVPPADEQVAGIISIGRTTGGEPLSAGEFYSFHSTRAAHFLPQSVEETAEWIDVAVIDGVGVYAIFTDASLVGIEIPPDRYPFMASFFANCNSGFLTYATLLTHDVEDESLQVMLYAVASMEASFDRLTGSLDARDFGEIAATRVYDLVGLNLLNHDLSDSVFLTEHILGSAQTDEVFGVAVIVGGEPERQQVNHIVWGARGIGLRYYLLPSLGFELGPRLLLELQKDIEHLHERGFFISADLPLRASADGQTMAFGLHIEMRGEPSMVYIYLLQDIPDSDYLLFLLVILLPNRWDEGDTAVLAELSEYIGIDLMAYWPW